MLKIYRIEPYGFASNCYLLTTDGVNAVAIDPGQTRVISEAKKLGLQIKAVLLTHGHFDHVGACNALSEAGVPIYCGVEEKELALGEDSLYTIYDYPMPKFNVTATLRDGLKLTLCDIEFTVIATPGHTKGGVTFMVAPNHLFTGDTLFRGSIGRADFPTADPDELFASVKKLYALDGDYIVYPGHDDNTTLDFERKYNMCVRG